ncbi:hypothetical protein CCMSSC00406_0009956 [Pleurotus cornucopiae]|uniref:Uncharacterized protein n=1 Tax=Pleurotus cornucopiae TaxID=5321 RepID=A0ACB7J3X1_PLECO|nr:hypothetical protein CCMSSC00406_0009956 [Pleurotus cornucopiae]
MDDATAHLHCFNVNSIGVVVLAIPYPCRSPNTHPTIKSTSFQDPRTTLPTSAASNSSHEWPRSSYRPRFRFHCHCVHILKVRTVAPSLALYAHLPRPHCDCRILRRRRTVHALPESPDQKRDPPACTYNMISRELVLCALSTLSPTFVRRSRRPPRCAACAAFRRAQNSADTPSLPSLRNTATP